MAEAKGTQKELDATLEYSDMRKVDTFTKVEYVSSGTLRTR